MGGVVSFTRDACVSSIFWGGEGKKITPTRFFYIIKKTAYKESKMKKGILLTSDVMLALLVEIILVSGIFYMISMSDYSPREYTLARLASDFLAIEEKNGDLARAIKTGDDSEIRDFIDTLKNRCIDLEITAAKPPSFEIYHYDPISGTVCDMSKKNYVLSKRSVVVVSATGPEFYIATVKVSSK